MLENIFLPVSDWGLLILRVATAAVFVPHGWMKLNPNGPVKGPAGFGGWLKSMGVPLPLFFGWLVPLLETVGAVLLAVGLGTRILALGFAINMLVAIGLARIRHGKASFMSGQTSGWEFEFMLMASALSLLFTGAGSLALDALVG
ncbi:MAG: hypothetical protein A2Z17_03795 [Gammaproteobacteria bacterium RBG_16_66_13]|nr:MAG: hypothetical protein A2Z17_03795 [Gammaproteobacteria bacterium RBG_16_66_13]